MIFRRPIWIFLISKEGTEEKETQNCNLKVIWLLRNCEKGKQTSQFHDS